MFDTDDIPGVVEIVPLRDEQIMILFSGLNQIYQTTRCSQSLLHRYSPQWYHENPQCQQSSVIGMTYSQYSNNANLRVVTLTSLADLS